LTLLENISSNVLWNFIYLLYALSIIWTINCLYVCYIVQYYKYLLIKLQVKIPNDLIPLLLAFLSDMEKFKATYSCFLLIIGFSKTEKLGIDNRGDKT
jgi:hypothetical protein